jgi:hypothetical protein
VKLWRDVGMLKRRDHPGVQVTYRWVAAFMPQKHSVVRTLSTWLCSRPLSGPVFRLRL